MASIVRHAIGADRPVPVISGLQWRTRTLLETRANPETALTMVDRSVSSVALADSIIRFWVREGCLRPIFEKGCYDRRS